jgi:hypothetical protein
MKLIIENPQTGEMRTLEKVAGHYPNFMLPWRVKTSLKIKPEDCKHGEYFIGS